MDLEITERELPENAATYRAFVAQANQIAGMIKAIVVFNTAAAASDDRP